MHALWLSHSTPGIYSTEIGIYVHERTCKGVIIAALFIMIIHWQQLKAPATVEWINCITETLSNYFCSPYQTSCLVKVYSYFVGFSQLNVYCFKIVLKQKPKEWNPHKSYTYYFCWREGSVVPCKRNFEYLIFPGHTAQ